MLTFWLYELGAKLILAFSHCVHVSLYVPPLTRILFFKCFIKVYTACDKECTMDTRVPNPISLYYT